MFNRLIPGEFALRIYAILVKHCGAPNNINELKAFIYSVSTGKGITEYRICRALGSGGKFWNNNCRWYVSAYREDIDERRTKIIGVANDELVSLREEYQRAKK